MNGITQKKYINDNYQEIIQLVLNCYKTVFKESCISYCSVPITSGKNYLKWLSKNNKKYVDIDSLNQEELQSHLLEVIKPNHVLANQFVTCIRQKNSQPVIDPTSLIEIEGWQQKQWRELWQKVIENFVNKIYFINYWEYSNGCIYEFFIAQKQEIITLNETQELISLDEGINLIENTLNEFVALKINIDFRLQIINDLKNIKSNQKTT